MKNLILLSTLSIPIEFTMDLKMLNQMNDLLQPKNIYPIHIEDYSHYNTTNKEVEAAGYRVLAIEETVNL